MAAGSYQLSSKNAHGRRLRPRSRRALLERSEDHRQRVQLLTGFRGRRRGACRGGGGGAYVEFHHHGSPGMPGASAPHHLAVLRRLRRQVVPTRRARIEVRSPSHQRTRSRPRSSGGTGAWCSSNTSSTMPTFFPDGSRSHGPAMPAVAATGSRSSDATSSCARRGPPRRRAQMLSPLVRRVAPTAIWRISRRECPCGRRAAANGSSGNGSTGDRFALVPRRARRLARDRNPLRSGKRFDPRQSSTHFAVCGTGRGWLPSTMPENPLCQAASSASSDLVTLYSARRVVATAGGPDGPSRNPRARSASPRGVAAAAQPGRGRVERVTSG